MRSALLLLLSVPLGALAAPTPTELARWQHASECVAVLEAEVDGLRDQTRAGTGGLKPQMQALTEQGFAFIGTAYKQGLREPLADELLKAARQALKAVPVESRRAQLLGCRSEGAVLLDEANGLERMLVANRAKARVERLLR